MRKDAIISFLEGKVLNLREERKLAQDHTAHTSLI